MDGCEHANSKGEITVAIKYQLLGSSGLRISPFALGGMTFGEQWGFGTSVEESKRVISAYLDAGGNFIDTADKYTDGESERILGASLGERRSRVLLATKYGLITDPADPNSLGNHRRNLVRSVEASLERLNTTWIDLLWIHVWYFENRLEDTIRAINDLIATGKVLSWGISDSPAWLCARAETLADLRGWIRPIAIQVEYSLIERTAERELLPFAAERGLGVLGSIPLGGSLLTGKHTASGGEDTLRGARVASRWNATNAAILARLRSHADELGTTPSQLALAWILRASSGYSVVPILGVRTEAQLAENLRATDLDVPLTILDDLEAVSATDLGFPHAMVRGDRMQEVMYGPFRPGTA